MVDRARAEESVVRRDRWLSNLLAREAFSVRLRPDLPDVEVRRTLREKQVGCVFMDSKVPVDRIAHTALLESCGFALIDTNITLARPIGERSRLRSNTALRSARHEDREGVRELARRSFAFSRFHLDPRIPRVLANRIKAEWAGNFFAGERGDAMLLAQLGEEIVGFLQLLRADATLVIDLIAVDARHRGRGIASDLVAYAERSIENAQTLRVGTQIANVPSIRLYESLGFRTTGAAYVFHYHSPVRDEPHGEGLESGDRASLEP